MAGIPLFPFLLTAQEVGLSTEGLRAVRSSATGCGHPDRRCAFVCADDKIGTIPRRQNWRSCCCPKLALTRTHARRHGGRAAALHGHLTAHE